MADQQRSCKGEDISAYDKLPHYLLNNMLSEKEPGNENVETIHVSLNPPFLFTSMFSAVMRYSNLELSVREISNVGEAQTQ